MKENPSRGYCGYYKGHYLRSMREFVFALFLEKNNEKWSTENETFYDETFSKSTYKPDFFLYKDNILYKIIEIKSNTRNTDIYNEWEKYFKSKNILLRNKINIEYFRNILENNDNEKLLEIKKKYNATNIQFSINSIIKNYKTVDNFISAVKEKLNENNKKEN